MSKDALISYGYGDGGSAVEQTDRCVHTWDGELYLEYHRGTYTSQAYKKNKPLYGE